uniref:Uncharacterized protein n=1 Tax=Triticum urartu TaxID=4572 RepID=A0A8R7Q0R1_TRIUA
LHGPCRHGARAPGVPVTELEREVRAAVVAVLVGGGAVVILAEVSILGADGAPLLEEPPGNTDAAAAVHLHGDPRPVDRRVVLDAGEGAAEQLGRLLHVAVDPTHLPRSLAPSQRLGARGLGGVQELVDALPPSPLGLVKYSHPHRLDEGKQMPPGWIPGQCLAIR